MSEAPLSSRTILVVEDDHVTRNFYQDLLVDEGYGVITAATGDAALMQAASHPIDAIVLDYRLPDMSGTQVCRQLRSILDAVVPILVITADRDPRVEADVRAAGATSFLVKPFLNSAFLRRLDALILPEA